jgi:hypothetical protein
LFAGVPSLLDLLIQSAKGDEDKEAVTEPKAGEEREFEIADNVKMRYCWIPAGEAQLGSPKTQRIGGTSDPATKTNDMTGVTPKCT